MKENIYFSVMWVAFIILALYTMSLKRKVVPDETEKDSIILHLRQEVNRKDSFISTLISKEIKSMYEPADENILMVEVVDSL